ncbi:MAG: 2,3,4,5-tetrahydropyridine-2-carboxylate N-succinyltransferase, partial [Bacteroidia bacterium]
MKELKEIILAAWENRDLLKEDNTIAAIRELIELIDKGQLRCAEPTTT